MVRKMTYRRILARRDRRGLEVRVVMLGEYGCVGMALGDNSAGRGGHGVL